MPVCFNLAGKPPPVLPDAAGSRARHSFQTWIIPIPCENTQRIHLPVMQNGQKTSLMFGRTLYLSERAVQVAGRWPTDGYPRGKAGCLSPSLATGRPRPSRLHSRPQRTSHSAHHRLHTGTGRVLHQLAWHCCRLHVSSNQQTFVKLP